MKPMDFGDFLDHPEIDPEGGEAREMATLYREVADLASPDPGTDYWNGFNHRLANRLASLPRRSPWIFTWPSWRWALALLMVAAAVLTVTRFHVEAPRLESLPSDSLALILEVYTDDGAETALLAAPGGDLDALLQTSEMLYGDSLFEEIQELQPGELETLIDLEG